jgi:hypothetical protein
MLTDSELNDVRGITGVFGVDFWQAMYGLVLKRFVTHEEVHDAHTRLMERWYQVHPEDRPKLEDTIGFLTRSEDTPFRSRR